MDPRSKIRELLEELRTAFISRGVDVDSTLKAGLTREEVLEKTASLDFPLPEELIELYTWRNGTEDDSHLFRFRDNPFISLERALVEQKELAGCYGDASTFEADGFRLDRSFPFAAFEGSWYMLVCASHRLKSPEKHPVVNVFEGIDLYFHSLESMLRTCIDWVRDPHWTEGSGLGLHEDVETAIWNRHNPGIFTFE